MSKYVVYLAVLLLCSCSSPEDIRHDVRPGMPEFSCGESVLIHPASDDTASVLPQAKTELYENIVKQHQLKELEQSVRFDAGHPYLLRYLVELPEFTGKQLEMPEELERHLRLNDYTTYRRLRAFQDRRVQNINALKEIAKLFERHWSSRELFSSSAFVKQYLNYKLLEMELFDLLYEVKK